LGRIERKERRKIEFFRMAVPFCWTRNRVLVGVEIGHQGVVLSGPADGSVPGLSQGLGNSGRTADRFGAYKFQIKKYIWSSSHGRDDASDTGTILAMIFALFALFEAISQ